MTKRLLPIVFCLCSGLTACGSKSGSTLSAAVSPDVWATVDGREIRRDAVDKAYRRSSQAPAASDDEALTTKLAVLNELVAQDLLLAEAKRLNLQPSQTEVDAAFNDRKKNFPEDVFQRELAARGLTAEDVKDGLRQDLAAQKVIDHEVTSKINITDQDIAAFYDANRAQFNLAEPSYHIAQIVITPVRDQQIVNRLNDDATTIEESNRKAKLVMDKLRSGTHFSDLAMDYSEDAQTTQQGGDLGFVPASALKQAPPQLRDAVLKMEPGTVADIFEAGAHTIVLLIEKQPAGQRDLNSPGVRDNIGNSLRTHKEQLLRAAYIEARRNDVKIVNYLAQRIVDSQGKLPPNMMGPSAPGK